MSSEESSARSEEAIGVQLRRWVDGVRALRCQRSADPEAEDYLRLKAWQSGRLMRTYADLLENPRYHAAAEFFLGELYGTKDFAARDAELERIVPTLERMLPDRALTTIVQAMRMDYLSESLDIDMVTQLRRLGGCNRVDDDLYREAYSACGRHADREEQIALIGRIGRSLDRLTRIPLISTTLRLMKGPAEMAGLARVQNFLQTGFDAFRRMKGADEFLATINDRETELMRGWFGEGEPPPPPIKPVRRPARP